MTDPAPNRTPIDTGDLWKWVQRLTRDRRQRLLRKPLPGQGKPKIEYVPVPSLLTQLREALASDNTGGGTGKASPGSRAPIDLTIEDLLTDMSDRVRRALLDRGARPRILHDPETGRSRHDLAADLRQLPALIVGTRRQALVDEWVDRYRLWVARAETILTADDEAIDLRGIRGHACPSCGESYVERTEPSTDPRAVDGLERFHDPALVIAFRDGMVLHATCRACSTGWWRGDDVDQLAAAVDPTEPRRTPREQPAFDYSQDVNHGGRLTGRRDDWWPWPDTGATA